jgi:hypothetical protein
MKMKKILNEWRKYALNEVNQPGIDKDLGAPKNWFGKWDEKMGIHETNDWISYVKSAYPDLEQTIGAQVQNPKVIDKIINFINTGFSYYVVKFLGKAEYNNLVNRKLDAYFNSPAVPQEHKEWFKNNYGKVFDFGLETFSPTNTKVWHTGMRKPYDGYVAFYAMPTDFFMFGDGIMLTKELTDKYIKGLSND